jgi:3-carboxy-cis,cis-muconate cycloisomerase
LNSPEPVRLLDRLFTTDRMRDIFSDQNQLQRMLDFEAALARALERTGVAPSGIAEPVISQCTASLLDLKAISESVELAGNVAIPMVKALTALVAQSDKKAAGFVHWGATSQDAIDTGLVLQLREALGAMQQDIEHLASALRNLVNKHKSTLMAGRTWLQQGPPVTFGLKAAGWLGAIERSEARLQESRKQVSVLQFGGAVGTLAAYGDRGLDVAAALADELKLELPPVPWHANRDRLAEVATTIGLLVGSLGKIARDISLMSQTEIDEVQEPSAPGRGGSSTMPHKRNPVGSSVALAAAIRVPALVSTMLVAMVQEHERGLGGWQAEWETLPEIFRLAAGSLSHVSQIVEELEIHSEDMLENLGRTHGLILAEAVSFALAEKIGKQAAHQMIEEASRRSVEEKRTLRDVLLENPKIRQHLSPAEISRLLNPKNYTGVAERMAENAIADAPGNPKKKMEKRK